MSNCENKVFTIDSVNFEVSGGIIHKMINKGPIKDVTIPAKFGDMEIAAIAKNFCIGEFGKVVISDEIATISPSAFAYAKVKSVQWSKSAKVIPAECFNGSSIENISNIDSVIAIDVCAFRLSGLKVIAWPSNCKTIMRSCFERSALTSISNVGNIEEIQSCAFEGCNLDKIYWPKEWENTVKILKQCKNMNINLKDTFFAVNDGIGYIVRDGLLLKMINPGKRRDVVIPSMIDKNRKITLLGEYFCVGEFGKVTISSGIGVEHFAFGEANVESVKWNKEFKSIPPCCFYGSSVSLISDIEDVEEIGEKAFLRCNITKFEWPSKCKIIPQDCFCESTLTAISNLDKVEKVGERAFFSTKNLGTLIWPSACSTIPGMCFEHSSASVSNIAHVENIGYHAFAGQKDLTLIWPEKCKEIPAWCFAGTSIKSLTNIENVEVIRRNAFENTYMKDFVWPSKCYIIPEECFRSSTMSAISNIDEVKSVGGGAFRDTPHLEEVKWPKKCKTIPNGCFWGSYLETVTNTEDVVKIGSCAFRFSRIETFEWPKGCGKIPAECFEMTYYLKKLDLSKMSFLPDIGKRGLSGVKKRSIVFPAHISEDNIKSYFEKYKKNFK